MKRAFIVLNAMAGTAAVSGPVAKSLKGVAEGSSGAMYWSAEQIARVENLVVNLISPRSPHAQAGRVIQGIARRNSLTPRMVIERLRSVPQAELRTMLMGDRLGAIANATGDTIQATASGIVTATTQIHKAEGVILGFKSATAATKSTIAGKDVVVDAITEDILLDLSAEEKLSLALAYYGKREELEFDKERLFEN